MTENLEGTLTREQVRALDLSKNLGKKLAREHPEIADKYREGKTLKEIEEYARNYNVNSEDVARAALHYALKQILGEKERKRLARGHRTKIAQEMYREGKGLYRMTGEEKSLKKKSFSKRTKTL